MAHFIRISRTSQLVAVVGLAVLACAPGWAKVSRHDVVIMKNGDHLTGEVKKLENGVLYVATDYCSGSIGVDWLQVEKVESTAEFQVVLKDGERSTGKIQKVPAAETDKDFEVDAPAGEVHAPAPDVITIESHKPSFWRQLTGAIDFGVDFTSGNNQTSLSSDASANYLSTKWMNGISFNSSFSGQSGASKTNLVQLQTFDGLFVSKNSLLVGLGDFLHSSQQDLSLRSTLGGVMAASGCAQTTTTWSGLQAPCIHTRTSSLVTNHPTKTWKLCSVFNINSSGLTATVCSRNYWCIRDYRTRAVSVRRQRLLLASS
jgi:uncharacterized protein DUF481